MTEHLRGYIVLIDIMTHQKKNIVYYTIASFMVGVSEPGFPWTKIRVLFLLMFHWVNLGWINPYHLYISLIFPYF